MDDEFDGMDMSGYDDKEWGRIADEQAGDLAILQADRDAARGLLARIWRESLSMGGGLREVDEAALVALCDLLGIETRKGAT